MSWASTRETTKIEDKAYCLLGIFDIQMPPMYGEGEKAFVRLKEEIFKRSEDYSLFLWSGVSSSWSSGVFAVEPSMFPKQGPRTILDSESNGKTLINCGYQDIRSIRDETIETSLTQHLNWRAPNMRNPGRRLYSKTTLLDLQEPCFIHVDLLYI